MSETPTVNQNEVRNYPDLARQAVKDYYNAMIAGISAEETKHAIVGLENVYVVFSTKTLQHWKGTLGTTNPDGLYFEVTYNGDKDEIYIDQYVKVQQMVLKGDEPFQVHNHAENLRDLPSVR